MQCAEAMGGRSGALECGDGRMDGMKGTGHGSLVEKVRREYSANAGRTQFISGEVQKQKMQVVWGCL